MDNPKKSPTLLSLCTGYGGLEKGIESVIGKCTELAYVEIEAFAITNLVNKMETGKLDSIPIWTDIKTFNARPFRGCVDILTGGYPCQPFSAAGKRNGIDDPRHIWPYIRTIVMDCKPRQCFFENVEGHLTLGISKVLSDLEAMGYRSKVGIFSATEVGASHQRKRVFILADSSSSSSKTGTKRTGRKEGADFERRSKWTELEHTKIENGRLREREIKEIPLSLFASKWPSRPGEPQYKWEESRIIINDELEYTGSKKRQGLSQPAGRLEDRKARNTSWERQTKPKLGRTIDGARNRMDRLRLLGNGIVWQTAAKAYFTLSLK